MCSIHFVTHIFVESSETCVRVFLFSLIFPSVFSRAFNHSDCWTCAQTVSRYHANTQSSRFNGYTKTSVLRSTSRNVVPLCTRGKKTPVSVQWESCSYFNRFTINDSRTKSSCVKEPLMGSTRTPCICVRRVNFQLLLTYIF